MNPFIFQLLVATVKALNPRFMWVPVELMLAQAQWETGHFTSAIFKENHNLFGMKQASKNTTALGTSRGHAKYRNVFDSVKDYFLFTERWNLKTPQALMDHVLTPGRYAEDRTYPAKIANQIAVNKSKGLIIDPAALALTVLGFFLPLSICFTLM